VVAIAEVKAILKVAGDQYIGPDAKNGQNEQVKHAH